MRKFGLLFIALGLSLAATAAADEPMPTIRQIMLGLTIPSSDVLFNVAEPPGDADLYWETVAANAVMLAESGQMLMQDGVARDQGDWMKYAQLLVDTSLKTGEAAKTRDVDAVFEAGFAVYDVCDACHRVYLPQ